MEDYVFKALMSTEKYICNTCLVKKGKDEIDPFYQDTGVCESCKTTNEVTRPVAAKLLIDNEYNLLNNYRIRALFFKDVRRIPLVEITQLVNDYKVE